MPPLPRVLLAASLAALFSPLVHAHGVATDMIAAANAFLSALNPEQRTQATFTFENKERENWHFVPLARQGLPLKQMTEPQRELAHALLRSGLSQRGHARVEAIIALESVLADIERNPTRRDPELYYVTIFGTPDTKGNWGWRVEGHHVSLNFTLVDGRFAAATPSFLGSNPADVRSGPQEGKRALAEEEDLGRVFVLSLTDEQRKIAVISDRAFRDILTMNHARAEIETAGLTVAEMTEPQKEKFMELLKLYLSRYRTEIEAESLQEIIDAGWEKVRFAWAGGTEKGVGHYYRLHGPTFLVEYDNTQNRANHIHTVWRDFEGDFGRDLLREHLARDHAK